MIDKEEMNNMFKETKRLIKDKIMAQNRENAMCLAVLETAHNYCNSILLLLSQNYFMPARALVRCLFEHMVKFMWCLQCPDYADQQECSQIVDEKINRWEKSTLSENIRTLEDLKNALPEHVQQIESDMVELKKAKKNIEVKEMPDYKCLLNKLPPEIKNKVSPRFYKKMNNAVHLDVNSMNKIYLLGDEDSKIINHHISELEEMSLFLVKNINNVIRLNYGCCINKD